MAKANTQVASRSASLELSESTQNAVAKIEGILAERDDKIGNVGSELAVALTTAKTIQAIRDSITPEMMKDVVALQGTKLGFRTDRDDKGGYSDEIIRDCAIEALMRGVRLVGNEMNIIASNFYATKEAFQRKLREYPGLTDLDIEFSVPRRSENRSIVTCKARWRLNGNPMELDREISIRVNSGMIDDAILGKADRKMRAAIYERLTGSVLSEGDVDDLRTIDAKAELPKGNVTAESLTAGKVTSEPSRAEKPNEEFFAKQLAAATNREELSRIAFGIKEAGITGDAANRLRDLWSKRNEELME